MPCYSPLDGLQWPQGAQGAVGWLHCPQASDESPDSSWGLLSTTQAGRRVNTYLIISGQGGRPSPLLNLLKSHPGEGLGCFIIAWREWDLDTLLGLFFFFFQTGCRLGHSALWYLTRAEQLLSRTFCIARLTLPGPLTRKSELSWDFICACWCCQVVGFFCYKSRVNESSPSPQKEKSRNLHNCPWVPDIST